MRKIIMLTAAIALGGAASAYAQESTTPAPAQPPAAAPTAPAAPTEAPSIQRVNVVDVTELPQETQAQVDKLVKETTEDDMQKLRSAVNSVPEAKQALDAKGVTVEQVVVTSLGQDGTLTLVTKKAT